MGSRSRGDSEEVGASPLLSRRYSGQDVRPTSKKELLGWYAYAFASETYAICGIGSFIPILLETLARENGVLLVDRTTACGASYGSGQGDGQCVVHILGLEINTASFAMYTFSISVLLQAVVVVSISCAADHGSQRKKLLLAFGWLGAVAVMGYGFVSATTYILGAVLAIVSNTSFGASFVLLNSFLPLLVRHHPDLQRSQLCRTSPDSHADSDADPDANSVAVAAAGGTGLEQGTVNGGPGLEQTTDSGTTPHHSGDGTLEARTSLELELSTRISAKGVGVGYVAGLSVQCVAIGIVVAGRNSTMSQRLALLMVGCWWAIFTIPAAVWLRPRPGPPLQLGLLHQSALSRSWLAHVMFSWRSLFRTIRVARRLVDIVLFLAGWFLLSDAIATTSSTAILFAKTELHMEPWSLAMINVIATVAGVAGAISWSTISRLLRLQPHQTILACIALFELIPIYGLLGYVPAVQRWGVVGLQQPWEMFPLATVYGFGLGGISSYCRSLYGELIPPGSEAAFYALYAITDKGSSVFGPAIVGAIIGTAGSIRPAFWFLLVVFGLPAGLIWFVDVERGRREGERLADITGGFRYPATAEDGVADESRNSAEGRAILAAFEEGN